MKLRDELLARRKAQEPTRARELGEQVCARFVSALRARVSSLSGLRVAAYRALPSELDPEPALAVLRAEGAILHFPRLIGSGQMEMAHEPDHPTHGWEKGPYQITQPHSDFPAIAPDQLDLILVPGVAFGPAGERVGMGGGYYDRYLPRAHRAGRVALAFDFQLVPALEQNPWDQPVHWIMTESRELTTPFIDSWRPAGAS